MSLIRSAIHSARLAVKGSISLTSGWEPMSAFGSGPTSSGAWVSGENAMRLPVVYACRRLIAYAIASMPVDVLYKKLDEAGWEYQLPYQPAPRWVRRPNAEQLWPEFIAQAVDSLLSDGNLFIDRRRQSGGLPQDLFLVNPRQVVVGRRSDDNSLFYTVVIQRTGERPYSLVTLSPQDLLHVKALTLGGCDRGLSPIQSAAEAIGVGLARQTFEGKFYVNGAMVSAVLEFPADMNTETAQDVLHRFRDDYAGASNAQKIGGLVGAKYTPVAETHSEVQFIESSRLTNIDIATRIFGIPPQRVGENTDKPQFGNNLEQTNIALFQDAYLPWVTLLEAAFFELLPAPAFMRLNVEGLLRGDSKTRAAYYQSMQMLGNLCTNEVRHREGWNPVPGGHVFRAPLNLGVVGEDGVPILPPRPATAPTAIPQDGGPV